MSSIVSRTSQDDRELLTATDLARILSISVPMIWKMRRRGQLPQPVHLGRCTRWRRPDIDKWLNELPEHGDASDAG